MLAVLQTSSTLLRFPASVADENILDEPTKRAETTPQVLQIPNKVRRRGGMEITRVFSANLPTNSSIPTKRAETIMLGEEGIE
jgi:hypothetical protein